MNALQLEITRLIWKKEYVLCSQWIEIHRTKNKEEAEKIMNDGNDKWVKHCELCADYWEIPAGNEIDISEENTPATLSDFHRWMNDKWCSYRTSFEQKSFSIEFRGNEDSEWDTTIPYDSSLWLLEQSEDTLKQIIDLINSNK